MEPQCHPKLSNDIDLETQQASFFDTSQESSTQLLKTSNPKRPVVLSDVIERAGDASPAKPPTPRPPPQPKAFAKAKTKTESPSSISQSERQEISQQNEQLLRSMAAEEVLALQEEMRSSIPEAFLRKLQEKIEQQQRQRQ